MMWKEWEAGLLALAMWREARGEKQDTRLSMRAVGHTIVNYARRTSHTVGDMLRKPLYISSLTDPKDHQLNLYPESLDPQFQLASQIADIILDGSDPDPTGGATHYFNPKQVLPPWAASMTKLTSIENHVFYRE